MESSSASPAADGSRRLSASALTRRTFLASVPALALPAFVPASTLGLARATPPSERIGVGSIGVGGRGASHLGGLVGRSDVEVVAVCDPYRSKRLAAQKLVAARGGSCKATDDFRELLALDAVDAVFIASPEHWHALHGARAVAAGKDVYGEKALTLTVAEGRALCSAVRRHGRVFQVGTQQRSGRAFRFACALARGGYLGELREVQVGVPGGRALPRARPAEVPDGLSYDLWLGPAPYTPYNELKCTFNWYFIYDYCVGWIQSWGVHHCDIALWGAPALGRGRVRVAGTATFPADGLADTSVTWNVKLTTPSGLQLGFADNGANGYPQGCRFIGAKGQVFVNRGGIRAEPASLLDVVIPPEKEQLYASSDHHGNFFDCVRTRRDPVSPVEAGHAATTLTLVSDIATRLGRELTWDWDSERFVGDDDANRMLARPMRAPWNLSLPRV